MDNKTFTIIIPHKNIPNLLIRCVKSIPKRDDIQIIIVDDNSIDSKYYLEKYPILSNQNIEFYITNKNKGAGYVRNVGLNHAKGKWIIFADADDIFTDKFTNILDIIKTDTKNVLFYYNVVSKNSDTFEDTNEAEWISNQVYDIVHNGITEKNKYGVLVPWSKAILHDFILKYNIKFEEVPCSNDTRFSALVAFYATKVKAIDEYGYCWMQRQGSLWRKKDNSWYITRMKVLARIAKFMKKNKDYSGYEYFRSSSMKFMNDLASRSKIQHIKANLIFCFIMHDYMILFKRIPYLLLHYSRII